jgi:PAS domain S-box-containing protein
MINKPNPENAATEIIIVEDSPTQAEQLRYLLEKRGFAALTSGNGEEAMSIIRHHKPAVVISDIIMPKMNGYELCRQIKADAKLKDIPVILMTSLTDPQDVMYSLECGADNFVHKSCNEDYLVNLIHQLLMNDNQKPVMQTSEGIDVDFEGQKYLVTSSRMQIINLLLSTYEAAIQKNKDLSAAQNELRELNNYLEQKVKERTASLELEIEKRKKTEEALFESEKKYRTLIENANLSICVVQNELIKYANPEICKNLACTQNELASAKFMEIVYPEDRQFVYEQYKMIEPNLGKIHTPYTFRIIDKDNNIKWVEALAVEIPWENNPAILIFMSDITQRRLAEKQLELAAQEWQTTFDSISDWISIHDTDFRVIRGNKSFTEFLNMTPQTIIGKHCYKLMDGCESPASNCPLIRVLQTQKPANREVYNAHLKIYMEEFCFPIFNGDNEITSVVHLSRDITNRKIMQEQLMVTDRLASVGQLTSGVAHEVNNPLTAITGFSDMLLERNLSDDIMEDLKIINSESRRASEIVKGLLTFSRKGSDQKVSSDICKILNNVLHLRSYEQKIKNITVKTNFDPDLPVITVNASQMQQVFLNIIINAEQAMLETKGMGTLTITAEQTRGLIKLSFTDDGPGISPENMGSIFTPFFTTKETGKGTGLGLSICYGIITEHNGRIYAQSKPGKETTFIIELPIPEQSDASNGNNSMFSKMTK